MIATVLLLLPGVDAVLLQTSEIPASRDATLIEEAAGALANGAGPVLFAGRTGQSQGSVRRGLLFFEVSAYLPANAVVEDVRLQLTCSQSGGAPTEVGLHRALAPWGEGASMATGGQGAPAEPGDATWLHRYYDDALWTKPGGHFVATPSTSAYVDTPGLYVWSGSPKAVSDVRLWLRNPSRNHGWLLRGGEAGASTVKRFESRESAQAGARPVLEVTWRALGPKKAP